MGQSRRKFISSVSMLAAASALPLSAFDFGKGKQKLKIVLVGTGVRGSSFWGKRLVDEYSEIIQFVGLCDNNPGRLDYARKYMNVDCPLYENFEQMVRETEPELVIVTTRDSNHHEFIIKGMDMGCDVLTEKPLTIDEDKCQAILDAERRTGKKLIVGFNYRWGPYPTRVKGLLRDGSIGEIRSVDFHWYLNTYHGTSYFRRWHGLRQEGGTLWIHKATHHFDLLNWWIDSDPVEVFAYGDLEFYGSNGPFRGDRCRTCEHKGECDFYFDITKDKRLMDLYVANEKYDGYIRDNCVFRKEINIYDKMSCQIRYANNTIVNYSLTTYSPFEGYRAAFNGTGGRIEISNDIPYEKQQGISQDELHAVEMNQEGEMLERHPIIVHKLWNDFESQLVTYDRKGHGGGDKLLQDKIILHPEKGDEFDRSAGSRDGAMSILIGIAARKSIESGQPVKIAELTDLQPRVKRM